MTIEEGFNQALSAHLRAEVARSGIPKGELAKAAGISDRTLARYLNANQTMSITTLRDICKVLGISAGDFLDAVEDSLGD